MLLSGRSPASPVLGWFFRIRRCDRWLVDAALAVRMIARRCPFDVMNRGAVSATACFLMIASGHRRSLNAMGHGVAAVSYPAVAPTSLRLRTTVP
jgi:hypothetical protein